MFRTNNSKFLRKPIDIHSVLQSVVKTQNILMNKYLSDCTPNFPKAGA
jgi:hypothetical protein